MKKPVLTNLAPAPIGPYSQGILAVGSFLFISGQIGLKPDGSIAGDTIESQTRQACENIKAILDESGLTFNNVVKTTVYMTDLNEFVKMNEVYSEYFGESKPARATLESPKLPKGSLIEIEAIAVLEL